MLVWYALIKIPTETTLIHVGDVHPHPSCAQDKFHLSAARRLLGKIYQFLEQHFKSNLRRQICKFPPDHGCVRRWLVYVSVNKFHRKEKCDKHQWTQWVPDVQQTHKIPWLVGKNWLETNRYCCTPFWSKSRYRYQYLHVSAPWGHGWTCHVAVFTIFAYCIPVCSFDD